MPNILNNNIHQQDWSKGWLSTINHLKSPNYSPRPIDTKIDLLVLHNISLPPFEYQTHYPQKLFLNNLADAGHPFIQSIKYLRVSSHFLIERDGVCNQFVSGDDSAFHAGVSNFKGRDKCNQFSIGIELEGCDFEPFTDRQYQTLLGLLPKICQHYPIKAICGHSDIAPDRKSDPGHFFDWDKLVSLGLPVVR